MKDINMKPNPHHRGVAGDDMPEVTARASVLSPLVEKVAVPVMWFGIGYLACMILSKKKGP